MARQNLNDGDSGLVYRTKLNDNFIEIFRSSSEAQLSASMYSAYTDKVNYFTGSQYFSGSVFITGSMYITGSELNVNKTPITDVSYIDFNLLTPASHEEGRLQWNGDDKTLEVGLGFNSTLQIGQEQFVRVANRSGGTIFNGQVVQITGARGDRPTVGLASADYDSSSASPCPTESNAIGLVTADIENNSDGFVTTFGLVRELDTSMYDEGDVLWLNSGSNDGYTTTRPSSPYCSVRIGTVITSHNNEGVILVDPIRYPRISYAPDVNARGNQNDGDILVWDNTNKYWNPVNTSSLYVSTATMNIASTSSVTPTVTSSVTYEIDESNNKLYFHIVYGDGTVHSASADIF